MASSMGTSRSGSFEEEQLPTIADYICPADAYFEEAPCQVDEFKAKVGAMVTADDGCLCRPGHCECHPIHAQEGEPTIAKFDLSNTLLQQFKTNKLSSPPNIARTSSSRSSSDSKKNASVRSDQRDYNKTDDLLKSMNDLLLLCRPRSYSYGDEQTMARTFSEEPARNDGIVDEVGAGADTSFVESETDLTVAMLRHMKEKPSEKQATKSLSPAKENVDDRNDNDVSFADSEASLTGALLKEVRAKTTPTPQKKKRMDQVGAPSSGNKIGLRRAYQASSPFARRNSLVDDQAKWSPVKARQSVPQDASPLRTNLEGRFKSRMQLHTDLSCSAERSGHSSIDGSPSRLSPLRIKLENKFKSSPLKAPRRVDHAVEISLPPLKSNNMKMPKPSLTNFLCAQVGAQVVAKHPWEERPKNDSTLETLLATVDESMIEAAASILSDSNFMNECDQSFIEEGIERELSISCIAQDEADIHHVADADEPVWVERSNSWELDGSFLKEAVSKLAEDISEEVLDRVENLVGDTSKDEIVLESKDDVVVDSSENPQDSTDVPPSPQVDHQVGAVLRNMNKYPRRKVLQQHGMKVLCEATEDNPSLAGVIVRAKGITIILAAMKRYPFERMLQLRGFKILSNVCGCEASAEAVVLNHDGTPILLVSFNEFCKDVEMVMAACSLFAKLAQHEKLKKPMEDAKAFKAFADSFEDNEGNEELQEAIRGVMKVLL